MFGSHTHRANALGVHLNFVKTLYTTVTNHVIYIYIYHYIVLFVTRGVTSGCVIRIHWPTIPLSTILEPHSSGMSTMVKALI